MSSVPSTPTDTTYDAAGTDLRQSTRGALLISPISLSSLPLDDRACPICHEDYIDMPTPASTTPPPDQEWAVSVDMSAEWFGPKQCCGHIIGLACLQTHLLTKGPWKNKCPLCRDVWYHEYAPDRAQVAARQFEPAPRRSARIAEAIARTETAQPSMSERHGVSRASRRGRSGTRSPARTRPVRSSAPFSAQLMAALQVEDGEKAVHGTLEELKERLNVLYSGLEG